MLNVDHLIKFAHKKHCNLADSNLHKSQVLADKKRRLKSRKVKMSKCKVLKQLCSEMNAWSYLFCGSYSFQQKRYLKRFESYSYIERVNVAGLVEL